MPEEVAVDEPNKPPPTEGPVFKFAETGVKPNVGAGAAGAVVAGTAEAGNVVAGAGLAVAEAEAGAAGVGVAGAGVAGVTGAAGAREAGVAWAIVVGAGAVGFGVAGTTAGCTVAWIGGLLAVASTGFDTFLEENHIKNDGLSWYFQSSSLIRFQTIFFNSIHL